MKKIGSGRRSPRERAPAHQLRTALAGVIPNITGSTTAGGSVASTLLGRVPVSARATWNGAQGATSALQTLPDSTLRWLAAGSVGLGAGLFLAGAPRAVIAAGVAPALAMGAVVVARPIRPVGAEAAILTVNRRTTVLSGLRPAVRHG